MRTYWIAQGSLLKLCGDVSGKEIQKRGGGCIRICMCMAESFSCTAEANTL